MINGGSNDSVAALPSPYKPTTKSVSLFGSPAPAMHAAAPVTQTAVSKTGTVSSGGGGSSSSGGGGGGGSSYAAPAAAPAAPPMTINDWLNQDSTYQSQEAALKKALTDYIAQQGVAQNQYTTDYATRVNDLGIQKTRGLEDQGNDYASRGMYLSGVYGKDLSNLVGDYARRQSDMDTAKSDYLANLATDRGNFQDQQQLTETNAKQNAIQRRAAQFGL
jgi:hypothetical protein